MRVLARYSMLTVMKNIWHVYIIECADGSLYTGIAEDVAKRVAMHNAGTGAKYTRGRAPVCLRWSEVHNSKSSALRREYAIKQWKKEKKRLLIMKRE